MKFISPYTSKTEKYMRFFYESLPENKRRYYAAIECLKLPYGGQKYISSILGCDAKTITTGIHDIEAKNIIPNDSRIRQSGGGRKKSEELHPDLEKIFLQVIEHYTAGNPMNENIKWINLSLVKIRDLIEEKGIKVDPSVISRLLKKNGFTSRCISKKKQ